MQGGDGQERNCEGAILRAGCARATHCQSDLVMSSSCSHSDRQRLKHPTRPQTQTVRPLSETTHYRNVILLVITCSFQLPPQFIHKGDA